MRIIINYIRSCFCKHEWEYLGETQYVKSSSDIPHKIVKCWRCRKCGYIMTHKL